MRAFDRKIEIWTNIQDANRKDIKDQNKEIQSIRTNILEEVDSKMEKVFERQEEISQEVQKLRDIFKK